MMHLHTTDLVFLGKHKQFSFLCTAGIKANSGICANINAFKLEFGSGRKKTPLYQNFRGTGTFNQKPGDF